MSYYRNNIKQHIERDFDEDDEDYDFVEKDDYKLITTEIEEE